jgi:hypothetical protein
VEYLSVQFALVYTLRSGIRRYAQLKSDVQDVRVELKLDASSRYVAWLQMPIGRPVGWLTGCKRMVMRIKLHVVYRIGR